MCSPYFEYTQSDSIHRFIMYRVDIDAIEAYFELKQDIIEDIDDGSPCLTIIDFTQTGLPPTDLVIAKSVKMMKQFKIKYPHRLLIISDSSPEVQLAKIKTKMNPFLHVKYITPEEEDKYMHWLRTGLLV